MFSSPDIDVWQPLHAQPSRRARMHLSHLIKTQNRLHCIDKCHTFQIATAGSISFDLTRIIELIFDASPTPFVVDHAVTYRPALRGPVTVLYKEAMKHKSNS